MITPETVAEDLGAPTFLHFDVRDRTRAPGVAAALAWTRYGGDVLFVEATGMPGGGGLVLTGSLGDAMKESIRTAVSWVRANAARCGADGVDFRRTDFHVHVQSPGGVHDGGSAGVAVAAALVSSCTGRPVRGDLAMTGEITLSGDVLPVAYVPAKVRGAARRGLTRIVLPAANAPHFERDVAPELRGRVTPEYVGRVDELLDLVLSPPAAAGAVKAARAGRRCRTLAAGSAR